MRTPTRPHATARHLLAVVLLCAGAVTACGLDSQVKAVSSPQLHTIDTLSAPTTEQLAESEPAPPGPTDADIITYVSAAEWLAAADYATALTTYVHALQAATPRPAQPPATWPAGPQRAVQPASGGVPANAFLACVRQRESGGDYRAVNRSSGAGGAYQFLPSTWQGSGAAARTGVPRAEMASPAQQDAEAARLYASSGRSPWAGPGC